MSNAAASSAKAINVFLYDIYHDQEIIKAGLVPPELVLLNPAFRPEMLGIEPPKNVYVHIAGRAWRRPAPRTP